MYMLRNLNGLPGPRKSTKVSRPLALTLKMVARSRLGTRLVYSYGGEALSRPLEQCSHVA